MSDEQNLPPFKRGDVVRMAADGLKARWSAFRAEVRDIWRDGDDWRVEVHWIRRPILAAMLGSRIPAHLLERAPESRAALGLEK